MFIALREKLSWFFFQVFPNLPWRSIAEWLLLGFTAFALFWKGGKTLESTWLLLLLGWFLTMVWWWKDQRKAQAPLLLWGLVLGFILLTIASYITSTTKNYGLDEVLATAALGMVFLWVVRTLTLPMDRERFTLRLSRVLVAGTFLAACLSVAVYALQPVNRMVGTFFDPRFHTDYWPNAWADFLLLTWPLAAWWLKREKRFTHALVWALLLGIDWGVLALSFSRGAIIAFAGQLVVWGLIEWAGRERHIEWKKPLTLAVIVLFTTLALFLGANALRGERFAVQTVEEKVTFTASEGTSSISERGNFWGQAAALAMQRPVLGWGPYSFRFIQPRMEENVLATSDHPHNVVLKYAAERGWVAALLFVVFVGIILYRVAWLPWGEKKHTPVPFLFVAVLGLLAHSQIDYNLQFVGIALPLWIFLGLLALEVPWSESKKLNKKLVRFVEISLMTVLLAVAVLEAQWIVLSSVGRHLEKMGEGERALTWYSAARGEWLSRDMHLSRAQILYGLKRYKEAQSAIGDYLKVNQEDPRAWKLLGEVVLASGNSFDAIEPLNGAYVLGRYNDIGITRSLVRTLLAAGERTQVDERREEFDALIYEYVQAIQVNAHYIALSSNVEEVVELANLFAKLYPNDAPLYTVLAARADHHAKLERERIKARAPGMLW